MKRKGKQKWMVGSVAAIAVLTMGWGVWSLMDSLMPSADPQTVIPPEPPAPVANPYTPEDFHYEDGRMTLTAGKAVTGIDVSGHQGEIDWQAVKASGVEFAMIRLGYRGYSNGEIHEDKLWRANLDGARAAGIRTGAYFYSQAISPEEAGEEAEFVLGLLNGETLDMPLVFDWEYVSETARTANVGRDTLTASTKMFCDTVKAAGFQPMIYFNRSQARDMLHLEQLTDYKFWLAMYDTPMDFPLRVNMWQYTSSGSVPGIRGNVDINLWFLYE